MAINFLCLEHMAASYIPLRTLKLKGLDPKGNCICDRGKQFYSLRKVQEGGIATFSIILDDLSTYQSGDS